MSYLVINNNIICVEYFYLHIYNTYNEITFTLLFLIISLLCISCVIGNSKYYNSLEDYNIIVLDKRYVPGFSSPNKWMLKVREEDEYRWVMTTEQHYNRLHIGDTIKTILLQNRY